MSKGTSHYNRQVWEDSNFPILCQTCLGDNPYLRMMVDKYGAECKICSRPFTTYRWCPGAKMRYKKTEVCQTCARAKNVCQTCLLDLEYGLPVQVRDQVMAVKQDLPQNEINREYYNQCLDAKVKESGMFTVCGLHVRVLTATSFLDPSEAWGPHGKSQQPNEVLAKLARNSPYYKRNRAHICSFWVKGECKRGEECPYRHEKPTDPDDPLSDQNIKDRYYGSNDPVAEKLLRRVADMPRPVPPEDQSVTTVYIGNVGEHITEKDLRDYFYQFGEIRTVSVVNKQNCAFVTFTSRQATETAIEKSFNKLTLKGQRLTVRWGKSQAKRGAAGGDDEPGAKRLAPVPGLPPPDYFNLKPTSSGVRIPQLAPPSFALPSAAAGSPAKPGIHYPSQDPSRMGAAAVKLPSFNKD